MSDRYYQIPTLEVSLMYYLKHGLAEKKEGGRGDSEYKGKGNGNTF